MAEITTIARPYAEALARLARETNSWPTWSERLDLLTRVALDPQLAALAANPSVPSGRVVEVILAVCGERLGIEGANFVRMLAENKRFAVLPEISRLFEEMKAEQEGTLEATIRTAFELTETQMQDLAQRLEVRFERKVSAEQVVDPELIGGVVIQIGDEVLDASVRGRLQGLAATLKA